MWVTAEVEIEEREILDELDDQDLIEELASRGLDYNTRDVDGDHARLLLETVYHQRRLGLPCEQALDQLMWHVLGRIQ